MALKGRERKIAQEREEAEQRLDNKIKKGLAWQQKEIEKINALLETARQYAQQKGFTPQEAFKN